MKKLLVLTLVLGLTSTAGAAGNTDKIVQLTVEGGFGWPPGEEVVDWVLPDTYILGIQLADGFRMDAMELGLKIIGPAGSISLAVDEPTDIIVGGFESWSLIVDGVTDKAIGVMAGVTFASVDGQLVDHILLDWALPGAVFQLTSVGSNHIVAPEDRLLTADDLGSILVIPEPMTIALLAMGGLALLRKRR